MCHLFCIPCLRCFLLKWTCNDFALQNASVRKCRGKHCSWTFDICRKWQIVSMKHIALKKYIPCIKQNLIRYRLLFTVLNSLSRLFESFCHWKSQSDYMNYLDALLHAYQYSTIPYGVMPCQLNIFVSQRFVWLVYQYMHQVHHAFGYDVFAVMYWFVLRFSSHSSTSHLFGDVEVLVIAKVVNFLHSLSRWLPVFDKIDSEYPVCFSVV